MIPFTDFGGNGPQLHFLHANGYTPACYLPLMEQFAAHFHVSAMHLRPLWPMSRPAEIGAWHPLSEDLLLFFREQNYPPVIGVGHSLGAIVTLRAALREPERFSALVLIDPVLFPPGFIASYNLIKALGLAKRLHPLIATAGKRRRTFDNLETLYKGYRRRHIFRYLSNEQLQTYVNGISQPRPEGGYELSYSPEWEARIYYTGVWRDLDLWWNLPKLKLPILIIRGAETDTFLPAAARRVEKIRPATQIVSLEKATHLVPLERPTETCATLLAFLAALKENK